MTVTINTLGTNSRQIVITGETSATNIINAVNTSLTALGWTLIDTVSSGTRGLLTIKVYSAPNADTVTTKYMIIRYDLHRQYWFVSCAENWNTTTNVATNESWYGGRQILLPLQYSNTILYVFATARYACFMGVVRSEPSAWQGVFEFERSAAEDVAANTVPCFGWTSSLTIGEPYGNFVTPVFNSTPGATATSASNGPVAAGFAPPRTASGITGISAANTFAVVTGLGPYPIPKSFMTADWSTGGITQTVSSHCGMLGAFGENMSSYVWDPNSSLISNLKLAGYTNFYPTGKIYGLKITGKLGNPLDTTIIPVDANLFYSPTGTNTTHCLLGIHGGYKDKLSAGSNKLTPSVYTSGTALGNIYQTVVVNGRFIYFTTSTGFHKFDLITLGYIYNVLPAQAYAAVKFDGGNNLYISAGTTTLYKLNLSDDTYTTLTVGATVSGIALDDDNLYAATNNTSGTTVTVYKISLSSFTQTASWSLTIVTGNYVTHMTTGNYDGYLYVASYALAARTNCRVHRVLTSDGTNSFLQNSLSNVWYAVSGGQTSNFDGDSWYILSTSSTAGSNTVTLGFNRLRLSDMTWLVVDAGLSVASSTYLSNTFNALIPATLGCMESPAFGGLFTVFWAGTSLAVKIPFSDPRVSTMIAVPGDYGVNFNFDTTNTVNLGQPATDHCSYYTFNTTQVIRYVGNYRNYNYNGTQTANLLVAQ